MIDKKTLSLRLQRFSSLAKEHELKLTSQRMAIFRVLAGRTDHPSAEEIHQQLLRQLPNLSLDTVYRTLWTLRDLGIVSVLNPHLSVARFDANHSHHHHFVCERCGDVQDYQNQELNAIPIPSELSAMGEAKSLHVEIRGLCRKCLAETFSINNSRDQNKE